MRRIAWLFLSLFLKRDFIFFVFHRNLNIHCPLVNDSGDILLKFADLFVIGIAEREINVNFFTAITAVGGE